MDIAQTLAATGAPPTSPPAEKTLINSDFDTFLKMMTAQLKNQDPLNPIESADFAVQLATFSGVEQQAKTNKLLEAMQGQLGLSGMAQLASWVGREGRAVAPAWVDGAPISLSPNPASGTDKAIIAVYDTRGQLVSRDEIPVGRATVDWDPVDIQGNPLRAGQYTFKLESYNGDELLSTNSLEVYARIIEVRGGVDGTTVILEGGAEVPASAVTALRN
ncbi:MAG: flagellar hook capping FlgD N-terminal domain-containing protein [Paracoccaceae bacterium]|nr:flagellar hook capping FlgD N-terminal domain-containing protein [Paracoccaceae bacterium]